MHFGVYRLEGFKCLGLKCSLQNKMKSCIFCFIVGRICYEIKV